MPIFYRGPGAHITHEVFQALGPISRSFAIRELRRIHIVQTQDDGDSALARLIKGGAVVLSAVAIVVALTTNGMDAAAMWTILGLLVVGVSATVSAGCWRPPPPPYELRATYRGQPVCLLRTPDEKLLGQVSRALLRALELADIQPDAGADGRV
jgi:hypothetical protein